MKLFTHYSHAIFTFKLNINYTLKAFNNLSVQFSATIRITEYFYYWSEYGIFWFSKRTI